MRPIASRRNGFWLVLIVSLAFNAGFGTTFGVRTYRHYSGHGENRGRGSMQRLREKLNLTPEQQARMDAAIDGLLRQTDELRRELDTETEALAGLVTAPVTDRAAIAQQLDSVASLRQRIKRGVVEHFLELKELLRPDQREVFDEVIRRHIFSHPTHGHGGMGDAHGLGGRPASEPRERSKGDGGQP